MFFPFLAALAELRQPRLDDKSKRITAHYSWAEIKNLIQALGKMRAEPGNPHKIPTLVVLRGVTRMSFILRYMAPRDGLESPTGWLTAGSVEEGS